MFTIAFVGAGSVEFTRQLLRDVLAFPELADCTISLHDNDPERLEVAARLAARNSGARVRTSLSRREALEGADVVVNMVAIGGHAATLRDFDVPETFGVRQTIGAMTATLGGVDALVFTAGVGENAVEVRAMACRGLGGLGLELDDTANATRRPDADVATSTSPGRILIVATREDLVIVREAVRLVGGS